MTPSGDIETVTFNNAFFDELGRSSGIVAVVNEAAERIADIARSTAPVKSGDYRDSITTSDAPRRGRHVTVATLHRHHHRLSAGDQRRRHHDRMG